MTIPFLDLFKKAKARLGKQSAPARDFTVQRAPVVPKQAGERLSKTVLPNATRTMAPVDPFQAAAGSVKGRSPQSPTPLTPEIEPGERSISIQLSDFLQNLPQGTVKSPDSFDANRTIKIKTAEVEKGMANGQPTVLLSSIYEQVPEIFKQSVDSGDATVVTLPFQKVMEQIQALSVRGDQLEDEAVPQLETPFLQVTIEDTKKFGTTLSPIQTSAAPPVKVEPATARAFAKAEPEPVAQEKQAPNVSGRRSISLTPPTTPVVPGADTGAAPTRIPFKLPPNGTGGSASERVPASSGPPVPTPPPAPPAKPAAPSRIPFKMTPPGAELKPKLTLVPGVESPKAEESEPEKPSVPFESATPPGEAAKKAETIRLRLNVCLRNLPAFQLSGDLPEIADDVLLELPFSLVESQLASGRVAIDPKVFQQAIPEAFRNVFVIDATETPVLLPLQEVLQHLPTSALQMRQDQEHEEIVNLFETPFSKQAEEDLKRFGKPDGAEAKEAQPSVPESAKTDSAATEAQQDKAPVESVEDKASEVAPAAPDQKPSAETKADPVASETEFKAPENRPASGDQPPAESAKKDDLAAAEAKSNAKEFVLKASCLPGVAACSISFADGLSMAGNFPPGLGADGLCAVAPSVLQKIEKHMLEGNLGDLNAMTLHCSKNSLTFFMQGNVCMTVLHSDHKLEQVVQEQLTDMTKELAKIFT